MAGRRNPKSVLARTIEGRQESCGPETGLDQCRCRAAVTRAYAGMQASGVPDAVALEAATRVYHYHHPEVAMVKAHEIVETWVFRGTVH